MNHSSTALKMSNSESTAQSTATARWKAVQSRDRSADGQFVYAVKTTGIFCRPTCPARRPKRENVEFFDTPEAAKEHGFRACKRCKPTEVSTHQRVVAQVQQLIATRETEPTLAELGEAVGMSPFHLQRLFKRATGLSPKQFALAQREERFKLNLKSATPSGSAPTTTVTDAMYDAGYGSSRALYDRAPERLGMKPTSYRRGGEGVEIRYGLFPCSLGKALVATTDRGLIAVRLGTASQVRQELRDEFPAANLVEDREAVAESWEPIERYLKGEAGQLDLSLDLEATDFQRLVWCALREIPYGETRSYAEVARMIDRPKAARAVARACATNPVALVIPCHRVVRASGELSGYRWGVERKEQLLQKEASG